VILLTEGPSAASIPGIVFPLGAALSVAASIVLARRVGVQTDGLDGVTGPASAMGAVRGASA